MIDYYIERDGKRIGPVTLEQLIEYSNQGQLLATDWVIKDAGEPRRAASIEELHSTCPLRRDGKLLVVPDLEQISSKCIMTGEEVESSHIVKRKLTYLPALATDQHPLIWTLQFIWVAIKSLGHAVMNQDPSVTDTSSISQQIKVEVRFGLSSAYRRKRRMIWLKTLAPFLLLQGIFVLLAYFHNDSIGASIWGEAWWMGKWFWRAVLVLIAMLVAIIPLSNLPYIKATFINDRIIVMKGAGEQFLGQLQEMSDTEREMWMAMPTVSQDRVQPVR